MFKVVPVVPSINKQALASLVTMHYCHIQAYDPDPLVHRTRLLINNGGAIESVAAVFLDATSNDPLAQYAHWSLASRIRKRSISSRTGLAFTIEIPPRPEMKGPQTKKRLIFHALFFNLTLLSYVLI